MSTFFLWSIGYKLQSLLQIKSQFETFFPGGPYNEEPDF